ncbi:2OG-Fe(II) oxygenase [Paraherbaspirillum soli]|uniref:2OG-Fe(II) oxygenase n=1 Tax=Paraherbaspirillum soli TaxID=631222 RepID=A0ABW0M764_9BURK
MQQQAQIALDNNWLQQARSVVTGRTPPPGFPQPGAYIDEEPHMRVAPSMDAGDRRIGATVCCRQPLVVALDNVLSVAECEQLIRVGEQKLQRSMVLDMQDGSEVPSTVRTSRGAWLPEDADALLPIVNRRLAQLTGWPQENGEDLHLLNYSVGGEYKPHHDYFPFTEAGSQVHLARGGQRTATLIVYLNDVEEGGATVFPKLGLSLQPRRGHAVYFEYTNSLNQVNPLCLHGGSPVVSGEKWIVTKWYHQEPFEA